MQTIPKKIHYCWFGGGVEGDLVEACKDSWRELMPDYEIVRWDETNSDMSHPFVKDMYKKKCWAFVADFIRVKALYEQGGFYFDTDIEVIKRFDTFLNMQCFYGEEQPGRPANGLMGAVPGHPFIKKCMDVIESRWRNGESYLIGPEQLLYVLQDGWCDVVGLPYEYFYPYNPYDHARRVSVLMYRDISANTHAIHHWNKSWNFSLLQRIRRKLKF